MPLGSITKQSLKHQPLKILLVFLCKAVANQLQQLNGCYGVSHIIGSMQRVSHELEIWASRERRLLQDQVKLGIEAKVQL